MAETETAYVRSAIAKVTTLLGYKLKKEQEESVFQFDSKDVFVYLPTGIDSVDIKSAICGRIMQRKAVWRGIRSFRPRARDVITQCCGW